MTPRRVCSVDANQGEIADAFRRLGWDVIDTHQVAQYIPGFPDLIVTCGDGTVMGVEIKGPGGALTADERGFALAHPDFAPVVVRSVADVMRLSGWGSGVDDE